MVGLGWELTCGNRAKSVFDEEVGVGRQKKAIGQAWMKDEVLKRSIIAIKLPLETSKMAEHPHAMIGLFSWHNACRTDSIEQCPFAGSMEWIRDRQIC